MTQVLENGLVALKNEKEPLADLAMRLLKSDWFTTEWVEGVFGHKPMLGLFRTRITVGSFT